MLRICVVLLQVLKIILGIWMVKKTFPDIRVKKGFCRAFAGVMLAAITYMQIRDYWLAFVSYTSPLFIGMMIAGICFVTLEKERFAVFAAVWFYNISIELLKVPCLVLAGIRNKQTLFWVNYAERNWLEVIWLGGILILICILVHTRGEFLRIIRRIFEKRSAKLFLIGVFEWVLFICVMWIGGKQAFSTSALLMIVLGIFCVFLLLLYVILQLVWFETANENHILEASQKLLLKHHKELKDIYVKNNQRMHDTKHIILYLKNCIRENRLEEALAEIERYTENLQNAEKTVWTGFEFLDFLINSKKVLMDERQIAFRLEVDLTHIPLSDADIGILMGNLFDNAIEAAEQCKSGERNIFLKLCNYNEMFYLQMYNSSICHPKVRRGKFLSSKEGDTHGYGIENIKTIVENYQGSIEFRYDEVFFEVTVLI